jgi:hypothetical protein
MMSTSSAPNSEQDLASIPMAQGGLSRLAIARLKSRKGAPERIDFNTAVFPWDYNAVTLNHRLTSPSFRYADPLTVAAEK